MHCDEHGTLDYCPYCIEEETKEKVLFSKLALGARFSYVMAEGENPFPTYVKLSHDKIAKWEVDKIKDSWIGQSILCLNNEGEDELVVLEG